MAELGGRGGGILTVAKTGYDGDPNLLAAPAIFTSASPGTFYLQLSPNLLWRKAQTTKTWLVMGAISTHEPFQTYIATTGDDDASGSLESPILSLRELSARCLALGPAQHQAIAGAGDFRTHDWITDGYPGNVYDTPSVSLGGQLQPFRLFGATTVVSTFEVGSTAGVTITASPSPGWVVNEHRGRHARLVYDFGSEFVYWAPIISNTADTITVNFGWTTITGAFFSPLSAGTEVEIHDATTRILPPATNASWYSNRLFFHGSAWFQNVHFSGSGGGFGGPTAKGANSFAFDGCKFSGFSGGGLFSSGPGYVFGGYFDGCGDVCIEQDSGRGAVQVNNCHVRSAQTGYRGFIQVGAGSVITAETITEELFHAKNADAFINDEAVGYRLSSVRDLMLVSRGGRYQKVNRAMTAVEGLGAVTRYLVRLDGGNNRVDLLDTASANLTAPTAYIRFSLGPVSLTKTAYADGGYNVGDGAGNLVFDGGSF